MYVCVPGQTEIFRTNLIGYKSFGPNRVLFVSRVFPTLPLSLTSSHPIRIPRNRAFSSYTQISHRKRLPPVIESHTRLYTRARVASDSVVAVFEEALKRRKTTPWKLKWKKLITSLARKYLMRKRLPRNRRRHNRPSPHRRTHNLRRRVKRFFARSPDTTTSCIYIYIY